MDKLRNKLTQAYAQRKRVEVNFYLANKYALEAKRHLEETVLKATASGEIEGKNAKEREANAREKFVVMFQHSEDASDKAQGEKLRMDLAQINVDLVRALIRLDSWLWR